ncbi:MAG: ester cyclase [Candidatus Bipolaricaulia bacterium]
MSTEENKAVMLRFIEAVNDWNPDKLRGIVDVDNYIENNPAWGAINFEAAVQTYEMIRAAMPDVRFDPDTDIMVAEGDKVAARGTVSGTHTGGELFGVPLSGKKLTWTGIDVVRIADGKIVERWLCADIMSLMQQLGVIPPPGEE